MCNFNFLDNAGYVIANLEPYQIVEIEKGFGFPNTTEDTKVVIWKVGGMSAITMCGTLLMCKDGWGVQPTDQLDTSARPTPKARAIYRRVRLTSLMTKISSPFVSFVRKVKFRIWLKKYQYKDDKDNK